MKKILLISDTHGYIDDKILSYCKSVDEVWHAGDIGSIEVVDKIKRLKPLKGVYGNIDNHLIRSEFPLDYKFSCENIRVWITHIGGYPNRYSKRISEGSASPITKAGAFYVFSLRVAGDDVREYSFTNRDRAVSMRSVLVSHLAQKMQLDTKKKVI